MVRLCILLTLLVTNSFGLFGQDPKVSVIIPCCPQHFQYIPELLDTLNAQTKIPDEVVISLSNADFVPEKNKHALRVRDDSFVLSLLETNEKKYAGENRNIACQNSTGEILITNDADDLPHPQRIEIIVHFLQKSGAVQLIHQWVYEPSQEKSSGKDYPKYKEWYPNLSAIKTVMIKKNKQLRKYSYVLNGAIAIRRKVLNRVVWGADTAGEDVKFNRNVISTFGNTLFVFEPLYIYRQHLSSNKCALVSKPI